MLLLKQIMRGMTNCYADEKRDGKMDYSFFRMSTIRPFMAGIDQGYFAEGLDGVGYLFVCGTNDIPYPGIDWISDFDAAYNCNDHKIKCHRGFRKGFETIKEFVELLREYKTKCIAGHSRGGALATILARHCKYDCMHKWNEKDATVYCITAGSPAVYNAEGADEFNRSGIISIRMKYRADAITYFPPGCWGYKHIGSLMQLGGTWPIPWVWDHYPENYIKSL